jgi:hypothetical protein
VVIVKDFYGHILGFLGRNSSSSTVLNEAGWTPFQTHYFSENLVALGIEPGPMDL